MGALQFCCPVTGQLVDCGFDLDRRTLALIGALPVRVECRHCRLPHEFTAADALMVVSAPAAPTAPRDRTAVRAAVRAQWRGFIAREQIRATRSRG